LLSPSRSTSIQSSSGWDAGWLGVKAGIMGKRKGAWLRIHPTPGKSFLQVVLFYSGSSYGIAPREGPLNLGGESDRMESLLGMNRDNDMILETLLNHLLAIEPTSPRPPNDQILKTFT